MSGAAALDPAAFTLRRPTPSKVTIAEGPDLRQALPIIAKATGLTLAELTGGRVTSRRSSGCRPGRRRQQRRGLSLPGDLRAEAGMTASTCGATMVARFNDEANQLGLVARRQALGITPATGRSPSPRSSSARSTQTADQRQGRGVSSTTGSRHGRLPDAGHGLHHPYAAR